jgi:hypothetical protein
MPKALSVPSSNFEHFGEMDKNKEKPKKTLSPILSFLQSNEADIMAILEVRS